MKWVLDGPLAAYDTESTGVDVEHDRIVTACVGLLLPGTSPWAVEVKSYLINPGIEIPAEATAIHGLTTEHVRDHGDKPEMALDLIAHDLARAFLAHIPVVAFNATFDFTLTDRELRRHSLPTLDERLGRPIGPVLDPYCLDRWLDPYRTGGRKLTDLIQFYGVKHDGAHDATSDALAAARVAYRIALWSTYPHDRLQEIFQSLGRRKPQEIADRFAMLAGMSATQLHTNQVRWRAEQQASLREYLIRKGERDPDCDPSWPLRPFYVDEKREVSSP